MNLLTLCVVAALLWGIAPIFEKLSLERVSSFTALTIRSIATSITLITILFLTGKEGELVRVDSRTVSYILLGGFFGILGLYIYFVALKQGEASMVVPIVNSFPLFTALYSFLLLREQLTIGRIIGIILVVTGIIFINDGRLFSGKAK